MNFHNGWIALLLPLAGSACEKPTINQSPTLHEVMVGTVDPVADVIWKVSAKSYGPDGNAQSGLLTEKDWVQIEQAGRALHVGTTLISSNPDIQVARPGVKILDEGTVAEATTASQVEAYIDRDRPGLARHARELSKMALAIEAAAKARNAGETVRLSEELDSVCESCHKRFWYPELGPPPGTASPKL